MSSGANSDLDRCWFDFPRRTVCNTAGSVMPHFSLKNVRYAVQVGRHGWRRPVSPHDWGLVLRPERFELRNSKQSPEPKNQRSTNAV